MSENPHPKRRRRIRRRKTRTNQNENENEHWRAAGWPSSLAFPLFVLCLLACFRLPRLSYHGTHTFPPPPPRLFALCLVLSSLPPIACLPRSNRPCLPAATHNNRRWWLSAVPLVQPSQKSLSPLPPSLPPSLPSRHKSPTKRGQRAVLSCMCPQPKRRMQRVDE